MDVVFDSGLGDLRLDPADGGYWAAQAPGSLAGVDYRFRLNGDSTWPDPASRHQPHGVHGPSRVTELSCTWTDQEWRGLALEDYVLYELHPGTFSREGTFAGIIERLPYLRELGITAVELMPVAQCPGSRNWGYDGVYPFAVQHSYGGPSGLQQLIDACHREGLAVVMDVVYNHLGPEGNYTLQYGPYFSHRYRTPWGEAINFDDEYSDGVRRFVVENALYWISEFHADALRLDAVHGIFDQSAYPILEEISDHVHALGEQQGRKVHVIAESSLNDPRLCLPKPGGMGLDGQWNDDFHHALRTLLTGDRSGYYADFGEPHHLGTAFRDGYVYEGEYSPFRKRRHGRSSRDLRARQLVVFSQNHDQVGNRMLGERSSEYLTFEEQKLAAGAVLLSPFLPLLFMGEEYGELAPFLYFIEHSDAGLIEAVRNGRKGEFASFAWKGEPPDPQSPATFDRCKLDWSRLEQEPHRTLLRFYRELLAVRKTLPAGDAPRTVAEHGPLLEVIRGGRPGKVRLLLNFGQEACSAPATPGNWRVRLDSADAQWSGPGHLEARIVTLQPRSFILLESHS